VNVEMPVLGGLMALAALAILRPRGRIRTGESGPRHDFERCLLVVGTGLLVPLVGFRIVWEHHFALTVPLILWLFRPIEAGERGWPRLVLTGFAVALVSDLPSLFSLPRIPYVQLGLYETGAVLLFALGLAELSTRRSRVPSGELRGAATR
jgi:hypothetical protein